MAPDPPGDRIVLVSPHLDDGVLSLGAAMASWARAGSQLELLTVFAGDPGSDAPAGGWDGRAGFATEGEAVRARRAEDARACALLGAVPTWLPFGYQDYERHAGDDDLRDTVVAAVGDADAVLFPGSPLSHPDHESLVRTIAEASLRARRLGFYVEQPYGLRAGASPVTPPWLVVALGTPLEFAGVRVSVRDRVAKWRAIGAYGSQLPLLALGWSGRLGLAARSEQVSWVAGAGRTPH
jgi:LmbE family N-acetylglucosaminyl deacetylase